jgi:N-acyl-phosphatidylethanolamine-hydrolysing phospholipase D
MSFRSPVQAFRRFVDVSRALKPYRPTKASTFWAKPQFGTTIKMSSIGGAGIGAALYAVISTPTQLAAQPEEAKAKAHHLKNGKGFTNPWDSYVAATAFQIFSTLLWFVENI